MGDHGVMGRKELIQVTCNNSYEVIYLLQSLLEYNQPIMIKENPC